MAISACRLGMRGDGDHLHVGVLDQSAPVAVAFRHIGRAGEVDGASLVAAGQRDHLAAGVGTECGQLDGASIIAADDAYADHSESPVI